MSVESTNLHETGCRSFARHSIFNHEGLSTCWGQGGNQEQTIWRAVKHVSDVSPACIQQLWGCVQVWHSCTTDLISLNPRPSTCAKHLVRRTAAPATSLSCRGRIVTSPGSSKTCEACFDQSGQSRLVLGLHKPVRLALLISSFWASYVTNAANVPFLRRLEGKKLLANRLSTSNQPVHRVCLPRPSSLPVGRSSQSPAVADISCVGGGVCVRERPHGCVYTAFQL